MLVCSTSEGATCVPGERRQACLITTASPRAWGEQESRRARGGATALAHDALALSDSKACRPRGVVPGMCGDSEASREVGYSYRKGARHRAVGAQRQATRGESQ
jgi:hypothetical protein